MDFVFSRLHVLVLNIKESMAGPRISANKMCGVEVSGMMVAGIVLDKSVEMRLKIQVRIDCASKKSRFVIVFIFVKT